MSSSTNDAWFPTDLHSLSLQPALLSLQPDLPLCVLWHSSMETQAAGGASSPGLYIRAGWLAGCCQGNHAMPRAPSSLSLRLAMIISLLQFSWNMRFFPLP